MSWETCSATECIGIRAPDFGECAAHLNPKLRREVLTAQVGESCGFLRGLTVDAGLLTELLAVAPKDDHGRPVLDNVDASLAKFATDVDFDTVRFQGFTRFDGATFEAPCRFVAAHFEATASFRNCRFLENADFSHATFGAELDFTNSAFTKYMSWRPMSVQDSADFTGVTAHERVKLDIICREGGIVLHRSNWLSGAQLNVECDSIVLTEATFGKPSLLAKGDVPWPGLRPPSRPPRLLHTRDADLEHLTISDLDLSQCRFNGSHNLDKLRIEGKSASFARTPATFRWAKRIAIAEEHQWRCKVGAKRNRKGWHSQSGEAPKPQQMAQIYRRLRKGREDAKDEPGAVDFYYGEMEMRRASARERGFFNVEHLILSLYWLTSGYGTRAWRAFTGLLAIILVASVLFTIWGLPPGSGWTTGLLVSLESATSLLRAPARTVTPAGEWFMLVLRYLGPVLLALGALALRSRVKR